MINKEVPLRVMVDGTRFADRTLRGHCRYSRSPNTHDTLRDEPSSRWNRMS